MTKRSGRLVEKQVEEYQKLRADNARLRGLLEQAEVLIKLNSSDVATYGVSIIGIDSELINADESYDDAVQRMSDEWLRTYRGTK